MPIIRQVAAVISYLLLFALVSRAQEPRSSGPPIDERGRGHPITGCRGPGITAQSGAFEPLDVALSSRASRRISFMPNG
jgi:hypothetical protein